MLCQKLALRCLKTRCWACSLRPKPQGPGFYAKLKEATEKEAEKAEAETPAVVWGEDSVAIELPGVKAADMDLEISDTRVRAAARRKDTKL